MKRIIVNTLIILTIGSTFILYKEKALAQTSCLTSSKEQDPANHRLAYSDGYRQGVESARKREKYKPRVAGGEFTRGFKDGYDGHPYNEQHPTVPKSLANECTNPNPSNSPTPLTTIIDIPKDFKFPKKDR